MKVVFIEEVVGTAVPGEVKEVKNGFARNYLLPRGLAIPATKAALQRAEALAKKEEKRQAALDAEARRVVEQLEGKPIVIRARVGEQGRLYGSVTAADGSCCTSRSARSAPVRCRSASPATSHTPSTSRSSRRRAAAAGPARRPCRRSSRMRRRWRPRKRLRPKAPKRKSRRREGRACNRPAALSRQQTSACITSIGAGRAPRFCSCTPPA